MRDHPIFIAAPDAARLQGLIAARSDAVRDQAHLQELAGELERALVLDADEVPSQVITMHARAEVLDLASGSRQEWTLVFPAQADLSAHRISVLAPLGTALLGYREGDELEWEVPGGLRRLRVQKVQQPNRLALTRRRAEARCEGLGPVQSRAAAPTVGRCGPR
jgi:regulator of nucleoside diphosphate kinase